MAGRLFDKGVLLHLVGLAGLVSGAACAVAATAPVALTCGEGTLRWRVVAEEADARSTLRVAELGGDSLKLGSVRRFEPPCAGQIENSIMGLVKLQDGRVFQRSSSETQNYVLVTDRKPFEDSYDNRSKAERAAPELDGKPLLSSDRVNATSTGGDYVGVWEISGKWVVQTFSWFRSGSFTTPRPILTSTLPIRSVSYFPDIDTPSGQLEIVQELRDGRTRALAFNWSHRHGFDR